MKDIRLVIADDDSAYLQQLTRCILQADYGLEVYSFAKVESLERFLQENQSGEVEIIAVSDSMRSPAVDSASGVKILLSEGEQDEGCEGYLSVNKYQKFSNVISEILIAYGKVTGRSARVGGGTHQSKVIGVYSPVGGSGKTTVALMLAYQLGLRQKKVFYQNYERLNSSLRVLPKGAQIGLSDVMVAVHGKESGIGLLLQTKMYTSPEWHFSYVGPLDSALDLNELSGEEQCSFLRELASANAFDAVVLDFESELNATNFDLLQLCDWLVVPFLPDSMGLGKLELLFHEMELHEELRSLRERMIFVGNKMTPQATAYLQQQKIYGQCAPQAMLPLSEQHANLSAAVQQGQNVGIGLTGVVDTLLR